MTIASLAFQDGNKWRLHDGEMAMWVTIADQDFLDQIDAGAARFGKNDYLRCTIEVDQLIADDGSLKPNYTVLRVHEHVPAGNYQQLRLEPPSSA